MQHVELTNDRRGFDLLQSLVAPTGKVLGCRLGGTELREGVITLEAPQPQFLCVAAPVVWCNVGQIAFDEVADTESMRYPRLAGAFLRLELQLERFRPRPGLCLGGKGA